MDFIKSIVLTGAYQLANDGEFLKPVHDWQISMGNLILSLPARLNKADQGNWEQPALLVKRVPPGEKNITETFLGISGTVTGVDGRIVSRLKSKMQKVTEENQVADIRLIEVPVTLEYAGISDVSDTLEVWLPLAAAEGTVVRLKNLGAGDSLLVTGTTPHTVRYEFESLSEAQNSRVAPVLITADWYGQRAQFIWQEAIDSVAWELGWKQEGLILQQEGRTFMLMPVFNRSQAQIEFIGAEGTTALLVVDFEKKEAWLASHVLNRQQDGRFTLPASQDVLFQLHATAGPLHLDASMHETGLLLRDRSRHGNTITGSWHRPGLVRSDGGANTVRGQGQWYSGQGDDSFVYRATDGQMTLCDEGGKDRVVLENVALKDLIFSQEGKDLWLTVAGQKSVCVKGQFGTDPARHIEQIEVAGYRLNGTEAILQMVQAMSSVVTDAKSLAARKDSLPWGLWMPVTNSSMTPL